MTRRKINNLIYHHNGHGKTDADFNAIIQTFYANGLQLLEGNIEYSPDMTNKRYSYRVAELKYDEYEDVCEGKTIGYLSAVKYFLSGLDKPYEILAYVS